MQQYQELVQRILNHFQQAVQMLERQPRDLPGLLLLHEPERPLWQIEPDELVIDGYDPHPAIKGAVSV